MQTCAHCGASVTSGGKWDGPLRYCNTSCLVGGPAGRFGIQVPQSAVDAQVWQIHQGACPRCQGRGPVDLHESYWVRSYIVFTTWNTRQTVCCSRCARTQRQKDAAWSLLFGWWGFPFGLFLTPVQVSRNLWSLMRAEEGAVPSAELVAWVRAEMVNRELQRAIVTSRADQ